MKPIHVVVADSSLSVCRLIKSYLESDPDIRVTGVAQCGQEMIELVQCQQPDVITMGLEMPDMNGVQVLKVMHERCATPIIVISGANTHAAAKTVEALQNGAVDFVFKFTPGTTVDPDAMRQDIISKVRIASYLNTSLLAKEMGPPQIAEGVLLPATDQSSKGDWFTSPARTEQADISFGIDFPLTPKSHPAPEKVIVIGASMGGPIALRQLLSQLPADFSSSIIVVQHLPPAFTAVLAEQLNEQLLLSVKEAEPNSKVEKGRVFITPGQYHLQIGHEGAFHLLNVMESEGNCPSINLTMQSAAEVYGSKTCGVLLTGVGNDGCEGLATIRRHGGTTFVQTPATCTAKGMPQNAIDAGVADHIASPSEIAQLLLRGY